MGEVPQAEEAKAKGAEVLPNKARIKTRKTPHIRITHLQAAVNSTRNLERVHIIVSCQQSAAGATLLHHLWRKIEKLTDLNKLQRMEKHLT